jgi:hypothetical protein
MSKNQETYFRSFISGVQGQCGNIHERSITTSADNVGHTLESGLLLWDLDWRPSILSHFKRSRPFIFTYCIVWGL